MINYFVKQFKVKEEKILHIFIWWPQQDISGQTSQTGFVALLLLRPSNTVSWLVSPRWPPGRCMVCVPLSSCGHEDVSFSDIRTWRSVFCVITSYLQSEVWMMRLPDSWIGLCESCWTVWGLNSPGVHLLESSTSGASPPVGFYIHGLGSDGCCCLASQALLASE